MEEFMKENYHYNYEFVDVSKITDQGNQYADSTKYRFIILNNFSSHMMHASDPTVSNSQRVTVGMFDFYFYDRLTKKTYPATNRGSSWASMTFIAMINTILKNFK